MVSVCELPRPLFQSVSEALSSQVMLCSMAVASLLRTLVLKEVWGRSPQPGVPPLHPVLNQLTMAIVLKDVRIPQSDGSGDLRDYADSNRGCSSSQTETIAAPSFPNPKSKMVLDPRFFGRFQDLALTLLLVSDPHSLKCCDRSGRGSVGD